MSAPSSTPTDRQPLFEGASLSRSFERHTVLFPVDLRVDRGEIVALAGPNGAGKSTLLSIVAGILPPTVGTISRLVTLRGREGIGFVTQHAALDPEITGGETLRLMHALRGLDDRSREERVARAIERFELKDCIDRTIATWSGGERRRLHVALELLHEPALLLLDEPTAGLDAAARGSFWRQLVGLRDEGVGILIATHDLTDLERHADRVVILDRGNVVAQGRPQDLVERHGGRRLVVRLAHDEDLPHYLDLLTRMGFSERRRLDDRSVAIWLPEDADEHGDDLRRLLSSVDGVRSEELHLPDLEGVMLRLAGPARPRREEGSRGMGRGRRGGV